MNKANIPEIWNAIAYLRLSKDDRDGGRNESNSIRNQRDLITDFVSRNPDIRVVDFLSDDGATGANFDRDAFKEMIRRIESGEITAVIVKDFSRLSRDHIGAGRYIERYFALKNIRFIAINDQFDSLRDDITDSNNSLIVPFKNIINEAMLEDISTKTRSQLEIKRKNGELICNFTVYGYIKTGKRLVVDEYASDIIQSIFERKILGYSEQQIADALNAANVLSPADYKKAMGVTYRTPFAAHDKSSWSPNAVRRILTNRVYIGHLEQGKRTKTSYRMKKYFYKPREVWSVHEDNHEPIVSELDFDLVQELIAKDTRVSEKGSQLHLFSGIMVCGCCGRQMVVKTTTVKGKRYVNYRCSTHKRDGTCKNNNVSGMMLERFVLDTVRCYIACMFSADQLLGEHGLDAHRERKRAAIEDLIDKAVQTVKENTDYLVKSYAHFVDAVITEAEYGMLRENFRRQIEDAEGIIAKLRCDIEQLGNDTKVREMIERFKERGNIENLDRRIVVTLIESIVVNDSKDLEINFRFDSGFDALTSERTLNQHGEKEQETAS